MPQWMMYAMSICKSRKVILLISNLRLKRVEMSVTRFDPVVDPESFAGSVLAHGRMCVHTHVHTHVDAHVYMHVYTPHFVEGLQHTSVMRAACFYCKVVFINFSEFFRNRWAAPRW